MTLCCDRCELSATDSGFEIRSVYLRDSRLSLSHPGEYKLWDGFKAELCEACFDKMVRILESNTGDVPPPTPADESPVGPAPEIGDAVLCKLTDTIRRVDMLVDGVPYAVKKPPERHRMATRLDGPVVGRFRRFLLWWRFEPFDSPNGKRDADWVDDFGLNRRQQIVATATLSTGMAAFVWILAVLLDSPELRDPRALAAYSGFAGIATASVLGAFFMISSAASAEKE